MLVFPQLWLVPKGDISHIYMAPQNKVNLFYKNFFYKYTQWLLGGDFPGLRFVQQHNLVDWPFHIGRSFWRTFFRRCQE